MALRYRGWPVTLKALMTCCGDPARDLDGAWGCLVAGPSVNAAKSHRLGLLLWLLPPLLELPLIVLMCSWFEEVAREALFGGLGTRSALAAVLVILLLGLAVAWRESASAGRVAMAVLLFIAAGVTGALMIGFLIDSSHVIIAVLLAHSTLCVAMIGRAVLTAPRTGPESGQ
jgi:hypothetical protein